MNQEKSSSTNSSRKLNLLASRFPKFSLTYIFVFAYLGVGAFEGIYEYTFASEFKNNIANLTLMIVSYHFGVSNSQKKDEEKKEG